MKPLLWIYAALYAALAIWGIREHLQRRRALWKAVLTTIANALGLGGMWLYLTGEPDPLIASIWALVFPLLLVEEAIELRIELAEWRAGHGEWADPQIRSLLWVMLAAGLAFSLPYFWMNFQVAYGT
jgi:hypothetical protein